MKRKVSPPPLDIRHYAFERNSRLPYGTFHRQMRRQWWLAIGFMAALAAAVILCWVLR